MKKNLKPDFIRIVTEKLKVFFLEVEFKKNYNLIIHQIIHSNYNNNGFLYLIENQLPMLLRSQHLAKSSVYDALTRMGEIQLIDALFDLLKEKIQSEILNFISSNKKNYEIPEIKLVLIPYNPEQLIGELKQWVQKEYAPIDERVESLTHVKMRRFDSLARILSSQMHSVSICGAVTIDSTGESPGLIVGANLSGSAYEEQYLNELNDKLTILKEFYAKHVLGGSGIPDVAQYESLSLELNNQLFSRKPEDQRSGKESKLLRQAVHKVTHALLYDDGGLTSKEKSVFLMNSTVVSLLPVVIDNTRVEIQITHLTPNERIKSYLPLKHEVEPFELKYVHAEQMIVTYLYDACAIPKETPLTLGLSKLCCATCSGFLKEYPAVEFRGHHQKKYEGVINLKTGERTTCSSTHAGPTAATQSPFKTPTRRIETDLADLEKTKFLIKRGRSIFGVFPEESPISIADLAESLNHCPSLNP